MNAESGFLYSRVACDWCMKLRTPAVELKQCGGCAISYYCSKECQTAAWPSHKRLCTSRSRAEVPPVYNHLRCSTLAALGLAGKDWTLANNATLVMMVNALVELRGGVDAVVNTPRAVVCKLGPPWCEHDKPLSAFALESMDLGFYQGDINSPEWTTSVALRDIATRTVQREYPNSNLAGFIPITYSHRGTLLYNQAAIPVYRPQVRERDSTDKRTKAALRALGKLCSFLMSSGVVLSLPKDAGPVVPDMGSLVKERKGWNWVALSAPREAEARATLAEILRLDESGLSPVDVFTIYSRLWPYDSCRV